MCLTNRTNLRVESWFIHAFIRTWSTNSEQKLKPHSTEFAQGGKTTLSASTSSRTCRPTICLSVAWSLIWQRRSLPKNVAQKTDLKTSRHLPMQCLEQNRKPIIVLTFSCSNIYIVLVSTAVVEPFCFPYSQATSGCCVIHPDGSNVLLSACWFGVWTSDQHMVVRIGPWPTPNLIQVHAATSDCDEEKIFAMQVKLYSLGVIAMNHLGIQPCTPKEGFNDVSSIS